MKSSNLMLILVAFSLIWITGCGGCNSQSEEVAVSQSEEQEEDNGEESTPTSLKEAMNEVQQAMKELNNGEEVVVVDFRELKKLMPERLLGYKRTSLEGEKAGIMGINTAIVKAVYKDGDKEIEVNIVDAGGMSFALSGLAGWATLEVDRETEEEIERTFSKNGTKYFEKYNFKSKHGETSMIADDRFICNLTFKNMKRGDMDRAVNQLKLEKKLNRLQ